MLDPRRHVDIGQATSHGDDAASEVALVELPRDAVDADSGVAADAAALVYGQCRAQFGFVESVDGVIGAVPSSGRCAATLDESVLNQFGLPLWPHFSGIRRAGGIVLANDGVGTALAVTTCLAGTFPGNDNTLPDFDLLAGESMRVPTSEGATTLQVTFEKFGRRISAIVAIKGDETSRGTTENVRSLPEIISRKCIEARRRYRTMIDPDGLVTGASPTMLGVFEDIHHANTMDGSVAVLLLGEPGVGKTHIAKLLHNSSPRSAKRYKEVNAGGSGGDLNIQKGEWLGYSKGHGISGVDPKGQAGHLTEVDGGTIFVDEFAAFSHDLQVIFLLVLEKRGAQQVGGRTVTPDVRCVFATNADVEDAVEQGRLRRDILDRIAVRIVIPPLRERQGDVIALVKHFAGSAVKFDDRCLLALLKYEWPGNVRELQTEIHAALARAKMDGATLVKVDHLDLPCVALSTSDADEDVRAQLWRRADQLARAEGFEPDAGLQHRSGEILCVGDAQASKMYANFGLAPASSG